MEAKSSTSSLLSRNHSIQKSRFRNVARRVRNLYDILRMTWSPSFWWNIRNSLNLWYQFFRHGAISVYTNYNGELVAESLVFLSGDINISVSKTAYDNDFEAVAELHQKNQDKTLKQVWFLPEVVLSALGQLSTLTFYRNEVWGILQELSEFIGFYFQ